MTRPIHHKRHYGVVNLSGYAHIDKIVLTEIPGPRPVPASNKGLPRRTGARFENSQKIHSAPRIGAFLPGPTFHTKINLAAS